ncbi:zinc alcohol dehydrogenase [Dactylonectria estremocensis]|uniref:Zinc alcohol dehydrogenase n=1 Tax=Dactylonectria estremocensis TaxID=1079267 RepID=A0A9P9ECP2_9HYPO|nr:zinc alcohol dehydrogenase [Dactylonectria estremocensis]
MKAWIVSRTGQPKDVLDLRDDWPTPASPKGADIMVKVSHAALNPLDLVMMRMPRPFLGNAIPGADFVGEVVQTGPSIPSSLSNVRVGAIVCGTIPTLQILCSRGTLAEYIVLPAHMVAEKPPSLEDGAAAGVVGVPGQTTAMLMKAGKFHAGDRVLVNGASGGVGSVLLQVLQSNGVHVTGVCSGKNEAMVRRLGASEVIDYTAHKSLYAHLSTSYKDAPFDYIIDCIGDQTLFKKSPGYLKSKGKFLCIAGGPLSGITWKILPVMLGGTSRTYMQVMNSPSGSNAREVASWVEKGWIKEVAIDSTFDTGDAIKAYEKLESKRAAGKIIIKLGN